MRKLLTVAALTAALMMMAVEPASAGGRRGHHHGCGGGSCGGGGCSGGGCSGGGCGGFVGGCASGNCGGGYVAGGGCPGGVCSLNQGGTTTASLGQTAQLVVALPADATLTIDGYVTTSTSAERLFTTPALETGKQFHYTLKATVTRDGKPETVTRVVSVRAGEQTKIQLDFNAPAIGDE